ncbi:uncharacterized protein LOC133969997 isoform X1 [Platichthys flesus]|uniref:uncharacterized protein LOC133969997 isoform X1 n=1 Tax=Platichthys flesus TaxID=8260 RepID=UPI002DBFDCBC|nr:uncharacterized protein LOC133969997 isoform X1 [Platichthys flesus]XP_062262757.1 uncharacterized protein LOC133969997 isoform X1 [Platichthys flesus]
MQRRRRINLQKSGGMSSDVQHGEVPSTSKLSTRTQKRSTHKAQKKMPAGTSAGRLECFIKMTTERGQIEMTASNLNQSSPVLDPITRIGQMTTERGQIEMTASNLNQSSPVLDPITRIGQCPKHRLVCATIGSLDKCVQCVGPVSSFKWLQCEEEIALSDTETKDSEGESDDSDTAVTASEAGNAGCALASTLTKQVQETADFAGTVTSTVDEAFCPSEGKTHQEHDSRKVKKKIWSKAEVAAVMRHFKSHIIKGRLATKYECSHCKMVEGSVLAQRTVQNIRDFVRNRGITAKRQTEQQKL